MDRLNWLLVNAGRQRVIPAFLELFAQTNCEGLSLRVARKHEQRRLVRRRKRSGENPSDRPVADFHRRIFMAETIETHHGTQAITRNAITRNQYALVPPDRNSVL